MILVDESAVNKKRRMAYFDQHDILLSLWKKQLRNQTTTTDENLLERKSKTSLSGDIGQSMQQHYQQQSEEAFNVSFFGEENSLKMLIIALLSCVLLIGVVGNLFTIFIFKTKSTSGFKGLRRQLILLAAVDLLSSITLPSLLIYLVAADGNWKFGSFGCSVFPPFHQVIITFVEGLLLLVTYEKYTIVQQPFYQRRLPSQNILTWSFIIMFTAILISIPEASSFGLVDGKCLVTGSPSLRLTSVAIYLVRDLLGLILTFYLIRKARKLVKRNCMVTVFSAKLKSAKRKARIVWIVALTTFMLILPGDLFNLLRQCTSSIYQAPTLSMNFQEKMFFTSGVFLVIQISRSCSSFIVYSCIHPEFTKRWCSLPGGTRKPLENGGVVIDIVAVEAEAGSDSSPSGCYVANHQGTLFPPHQHQLIVNLKDEYLNCLTETSSCSSSMF